MPSRVFHCIFGLLEAQTEIADAIDDYAIYGGGDAAIKAAVRKRYAAAVKLIDALEDRESWPEALR